MRYALDVERLVVERKVKKTSIDLPVVRALRHSIRPHLAQEELDFREAVPEHAQDRREHFVGGRRHETKVSRPTSLCPTRWTARVVCSTCTKMRRASSSSSSPASVIRTLRLVLLKSTNPISSSNYFIWLLKGGCTMWSLWAARLARLLRYRHEVTQTPQIYVCVISETYIWGRVQYWTSAVVAARITI